MDFIELLREDLIHCNASASNKEDLLKKMASAMYDQGYVKKEYIEGVLDREKTNPTGLQLEVFGCAIPHSEMVYVNEPAISLATLAEPVVFQRMDDFSASVKVRLVFMLAVDEGLKQVNTLQELMGVLQSNEKIEELLKAKSADEVLSGLKNMEKAGL